MVWPQTHSHSQQSPSPSSRRGRNNTRWETISRGIFHQTLARWVMVITVGTREAWVRVAAKCQNLCKENPVPGSSCAEMWDFRKSISESGVWLGRGSGQGGPGVAGCDQGRGEGPGRDKTQGSREAMQRGAASCDSSWQSPGRPGGDPGVGGEGGKLWL